MFLLPAMMNEQFYSKYACSGIKRPIIVALSTEQGNSDIGFVIIAVILERFLYLFEHINLVFLNISI